MRTLKRLLLFGLILFGAFVIWLISKNRLWPEISFNLSPNHGGMNASKIS